MFKLEPGEQMIKKTKPHSASFLSSPLFWIGILIIVVGLIGRHLGGLIQILLITIGVVLSG